MSSVRRLGASGIGGRLRSVSPAQDWNVGQGRAILTKDFRIHSMQHDDTSESEKHCVDGIARGRAARLGSSFEGVCGVLTRDDLPALFQAADDTARRAQRRYYASVGVQLLLAVGAALAGAFSWHIVRTGPDCSAIIAGVAFALAALLRIQGLESRPQHTWFDARAAAESTKTLAWRYAVGGHPFPVDADNLRSADGLLVARIGAILADLGNIHLSAGFDADCQISGSMRLLRAEPLERRKAAYASERIEDQRLWYSYKARQNEKRARLWGIFVVALATVGTAGAILKAIGIGPVSLLGLASASIAGATAWSQARQYGALSRAYSVASLEISSVKALLGESRTESEWASWVEQAEEAISREHILWQASHR